MHRKTLPPPPPAPAPSPTPVVGTWENMLLTPDNFVEEWDSTIANGVINLHAPYLGDAKGESALVLSKLSYLNPRIRVTFSYKQNWGVPLAYQCYWQLNYYKDISSGGIYNKNMNSLIAKPASFLQEIAWADLKENWANPELPSSCLPSKTGSPVIQHILETQIIGQNVTAILNGKTLFNNQAPTSWANPSAVYHSYFTGPAQFGLYCEDSNVLITKVERFIAA